MTDRASTASIVELCTSEDGVAKACETIEAFAENGQWQELAGLATSLEDRAVAAAKADRVYFETVLDHVEDHLAICKGDGAVDAMLALSLTERHASVILPRSHTLRTRAFASRLGFGQPPDALAAALGRAGERPEYRELFACWLHELVLREHTLVDPAVLRFHASLADHPLGGLPLVLRRTERETPSYMPLYGDASLGSAIEALASAPRAGHTIPPPANGAHVTARPAEGDPRLEAAVKPWSEGRKGKVEAKVFALSAEVPANAAGSWLLRALSLDATADSPKLESVRVEPQAVFGTLFAAAANGGAYSAGLGGAYGRLAAWTTYGGLVGAADPAAYDASALDAIEARASGAVFLSFRAQGPWFHDVAWDLGFLALRSEGTSVAVLAATDA